MCIRDRWFPLFLRLGIVIFDMLVLELVPIPIFSLIRWLLILRGGAVCLSVCSFLGFGTLIFVISTLILVSIPIFNLIRWLWFLGAWCHFGGRLPIFLLFSSVKTLIFKFPVPNLVSQPIFILIWWLCNFSDFWGKVTHFWGPGVRFWVGSVVTSYF